MLPRETGNKGLKRWRRMNASRRGQQGLMHREVKCAEA